MSETHTWYRQLIEDQKVLNEEGLKYLGLLAHFADLKDDASARISASAGRGNGAVEDPALKAYLDKLTAAKEITRDQTRTIADPYTGKPIHPDLTGDAMAKAQEARIAQENAAFVEFNDGILTAAQAARENADAVRESTAAFERDNRIHHAGVDLTKGAFGVPTSESLDKAGFIQSMGSAGVDPTPFWNKAPVHNNTFNINVNGLIDDSGKRQLGADISDHIYKRLRAGLKSGSV